jgi:hypothetical protein
MAGSIRIDFLVNSAPATGAAMTFKGGKLYVFAEATWGGGSAKIQFQSPQGTWIDVTNLSFSANSGILIELPPGQYRAVSTTATACYLSAVSVPSSVTG